MSKQYDHDQTLLVGEVSEVWGKKITIEVYESFNSPFVLNRGDLIKNLSVNNFLVIHKGFNQVVARVEGEKVVSVEDKLKPNVKRLVYVSIIGNIDNQLLFTSGLDEIPLIGNKVYLPNKTFLSKIHQNTEKSLAISIGTDANTASPFSLEIDKIFNSHIAIFGNTGSGKSNTLTLLYEKLFAKIGDLQKINAKYVIFDFNGEYTGKKCLSEYKTCYNLSSKRTGKANSNKIPISGDEILDLELLSILSQATDKTQKPFLKRSLKKYRKLNSNFLTNYKNELKNFTKDIFCLSDKEKADLLIGYLESIVNPDSDLSLDLDYRFYAKDKVFYRIDPSTKKAHGWFNSSPQDIENLEVYKRIDSITVDDNTLKKFMLTTYLQIIYDLLYTNHNDEHIGPVIKKLRSKSEDLLSIIDFSRSFSWDNNIVVVNLNHTHVEIKKIIPLIISKMLYDRHKQDNEEKKGILNIIIDEAHNILSEDSTRETKEWRDHRLEIFEEIIKEGRKFGVFLTISSQRPSDISPTITSQAHNFFIHRLINNKDLEMISKAVSYIDKISEESIPTLPQGQCIFSGISANFPTKIKVTLLEKEKRPQSHTPTYQELFDIAEAEELLK